MLFATPRFTTGNIGGRSGADSQCVSAKPSEVTQANVRAFITVALTDRIADMPTNYSVPTNQAIKSPNGTLLANNWSDLIDNSLSTDLQSAGLATAHSEWWSGSTSTGGLAVNNCLLWVSNLFTLSGATGLTNSSSSFLTGGGNDVCNNTSSKYILCLAFDN